MYSEEVLDVVVDSDTHLEPAVGVTVWAHLSKYSEEGPEEAVKVWATFEGR